MKTTNIPRQPQEVLEETNEIIICSYCNKEQEKIITVLVCEAKDAVWYKCSQTNKCPLFQNRKK